MYVLSVFLSTLETLPMLIWEAIRSTQIFGFLLMLIFYRFVGFKVVSKLLRLLLKVTEVPMKHQKCKPNSPNQNIFIQFEGLWAWWEELCPEIWTNWIIWSDWNVQLKLGIIDCWTSRAKLALWWKLCKKLLFLLQATTSPPQC